MTSPRFTKYAGQPIRRGGPGEPDLLGECVYNQWYVRRLRTEDAIDQMDGYKCAAGQFDHHVSSCFLVLTWRPTIRRKANGRYGNGSMRMSGGHD